MFRSTIQSVLVVAIFGSCAGETLAEPVGPTPVATSRTLFTPPSPTAPDDGPTATATATFTLSPTPNSDADVDPNPDTDPHSPTAPAFRTSAAASARIEL